MAEEIAETQVVVFKIGEEHYGVDIFRVKEIIRFTEITKIPSVPEFIEGVLNLRGKVIPILDLKRSFQSGQLETRQNSKIIIVEIKEQVMGLIVDGVEEVIRLKADLIEMPSTLNGVVAKYVKGVGKVKDMLLILLELDMLLVQEELSKLKDVV